MVTFTFESADKPGVRSYIMLLPTTENCLKRDITFQLRDSVTIASLTIARPYVRKRVEQTHADSSFIKRTEETMRVPYKIERAK